MGIDDKTINEIVRRVIGVVSAERIILFGSAATGQMTGDSDIDLLILASSLSNRREDWVRVQQALRGMGCPFDIIIMTRERFEETKDVIGGIAYPANKQGRVIYEAA
jgi:predicted nucleotidyltransferase